ncbi:Octanoate-[acyl-carrier-protein]-protein-N-octanoyltransferase [hydrothermal vent metagenome]|uniref:lipoyl(octanoyl) transferase n=1 Tax=hydrothermal vent metagenome TaxID=652676 RepID=A0A3B1B062_9ZZZZ
MNPPLIRHLGLRDYESVWHEMQDFTSNRSADTADEIWLLEHPPVFTLGLNGKREHLLSPGDIPVVKCDRGGQVTYHGPGQLIAYLLLDLKRRRLGVKAMVWHMEQVLIDLLADYGIDGQRHAGAPGIYLDGKKIAALGLRVRRACSYHGLSLNVDMDLEPFSRINPCGYKGLESTQLRELLSAVDPDGVAAILLQQLQKHFPAT